MGAGAGSGLRQEQDAIEALRGAANSVSCRGRGGGGGDVRPQVGPVGGCQGGLVLDAVDSTGDRAPGELGAALREPERLEHRRRDDDEGEIAG